MIKMNEENRLIIKQINKFGRVLETSELLKMIEDLENNWNELKKWLEENKHFYNITGEDLEEYTTITEVLNKMQELEQGKDE